MALSAHAADTVKSVRDEFGAELKKEKPNYPSLIGKATKAIDSLPEKWSADDAWNVVMLLQLDQAVDNGRTLFDNTFDALKKNKAAINAALKKLPKKEAESLTRDIDTAIRANEQGQDN